MFVRRALSGVEQSLDDRRLDSLISGLPCDGSVLQSNELIRVEGEKLRVEEELETMSKRFDELQRDLEGTKAKLLEKEVRRFARACIRSCATRPCGNLLGAIDRSVLVVHVQECTHSALYVCTRPEICKWIEIQVSRKRWIREHVQSQVIEQPRHF